MAIAHISRSSTPPLNDEVGVGKDMESSHVETTGFDGLSEEDHQWLASLDEGFKRKVVRKLDFRLIPMLGILYLISYIDRANIGNAKIEGLTTDLKLDDTQYNVALSIFFVPYIIFEVPSNTILAKFKRPSVYIGALVVSWGVVMTLTGIVQNFGGLVAARIFLGVCEAGFFPGAVFLISRWYLPHETQTRLALFYTASALAGAFSGLLAYAITKMDGIAGVAGWRWIFIIEGIASVLAGLSCFLFLLDTPALSHRWLTPSEIRYLELRQLALHGMSASARAAETKHKWSLLRSVLSDWHIYVQALIYWSNTCPNYGLKFTMPQIIKNMGFTSSNAQLMTVPPYIAGAVAAYVSALFADRIKWRMPFIVGAQTLVLIAFAILFPLAPKIQDNIGVCYFAVILSCIGLYPISPGISAWSVNNLAGPTRRAQGIAYMLGLGNIGGIFGSYIYLDKEAPRYPTGFGTSLAFAAMGIVACFGLEFGYWSSNKRRERLNEDEIREKYSQEELDRMGDWSPLFKYTL